MVKIFYDSLCPVCNKEVMMLRRLDRRRRIEFIDITDDNFNASRYQRTLDDFIGTIHGQTENGQLITGMKVFRMVYGEVGLGWLLAWTSWPVLRPLADNCYNLFAKLRPRFSRFQHGCKDDRCSVKRAS